MSRLRINYPDGDVQHLAIPDGPCVDGRDAHDWHAFAEHPRTGTGARDSGGNEVVIVHDDLVEAVRAECAVCHGALGRTFHPPVSGNVAVAIV